jgi:chitodextrinase
MKSVLQSLSLLIGLFLLLMSEQAHAQTPVAQYSFTGNANDQINANNAAVNGATLTQDRFNWANRAFAFDGVQSGLRASNTALINTANESISFWVKVKALPATGEAYILSHGGWQDRWKISLPSHGKPVFSTKNAAGVNVDMDSDSVALPVGAWRHVVMTHDGTVNVIYINGVLKKSVASVGALGNTTKPLGIGYDPIDTTNYFNGALDEVMLFNVALTAAQVTTLYTTQSTAPTFANERVAAYSLNGSGYDSSAYANHAALTNVKATTDRFGFGSKAYDFNGTSSSVKAPNSAPLNSANTTVSFWVKVNALPVTGEAFLFSYGGWQERLKISLPAHGKVVFSTNNVGTGNSDMDAGDGNALPVNVWKHVVMTHDGANDKVFIDGVRKATKAVVGALKSTTNPVGIGYDPIDGGSFFNGSLDDVQVYNYALTEGEVTALYTAQALSPATATDLVADYNLNGNGIDASQFANHATGKAMPAANRFNLGGNAMSFNGTKSDSLIASNSVVLQSDFETVSFWIRVTAFPVTGEAYILSHGGWQDRFKISLPSHGKPVFSTKNAAGQNVDMDSDSVPLPVGQWRHVVMVHDGTNNKLFINGLLKKSVAAAGALGKTNRPVGIGYDPIDGGANFNGSLDDIKLYNRALTDAEIATLYAAQNVAPVIAGNLVASYPFNNDGTDITAYGNNTSTTNALPTTDRFGKSNKAFAFNNSQAKAANSAQLSSANTTISFWVKVAALPASGEAYILSHGGWQDRWKISLPAHGKPVFSTKNAAGANVDMDADSVSLPVGQWRHVAMTHDGATNKIFINGLLKKSVVATGGLGTTTKPFGIGYDPIDSSGFFNGALDDIQIYNNALSDAEIATLYAAQNVAPPNTDTQAPSTPLSISAVVAFTNVTLSWLPSTDNVGVVGYNVFRNNTLFLNTPNTSNLLTGLTATTKYTFGVTAIDAAGNESAMSTLQVTTGQDQTRDSIAPSVPTNLTAQIGSNSVQLAWTASTDNRGVAGYIVFQDGVVIDTVLAPSLTKFVSGLASITAYTFEVLAYDAAKNKSAKAEKTVTTLAPVNTGEPGLIANYPFDDNANDATPYNNHGTIGGTPTFITHTGLAGKAIKFGKTDSVIVKNAVQLISDYATVGFWIRVDSTNLADAEAYVIDFGHWDQRWKISLPQHLRIVWTTNAKNTLSNNFIVDMDAGDGNELVKNIWWHVTMVCNGVNNIIYVNGVETKRVPAVGKLNSTARSMYFGNNGTDGGQHFFGALDNVKIYNKAMTAAEINKLFRTGTTPVDEQASAALLTLVKGISPNPVANELTVKHNFTGKEAVLVRVFDVFGRQIDALSFEQNNMPLGQFSLNTSTYVSGTYLINFVQDGKSLGAMKFVKN